MKSKAEKRIISRKREISKRQVKPVIAKKKPVNVHKRKAVNRTKKQVKNRNQPTIAMKSKVYRDKNGHILAGSGSNGGGRPKGSLSGARASELQAAITRVELDKCKNKKKKKTWLDHQIEKSYNDTPLAIAILSRLYPALKSIEQVTFASDSMDDQEALGIQEELRKRCKTVVSNTERKS